VVLEDRVDCKDGVLSNVRMSVFLLISSHLTNRGNSPDMTGLLVLAVPVVLILGLSEGTVTSLLGCTRWGVANNQLCPRAQSPVAYQVITDCVTTNQLNSPRTRQSLPDHNHLWLQFPSIIQFRADPNASAQPQCMQQEAHSK
jgi:hypothetical protein